MTESKTHKICKEYYQPDSPICNHVSCYLGRQSAEDDSFGSSRYFLPKILQRISGSSALSKLLILTFIFPSRPGDIACGFAMGVGSERNTMARFSDVTRGKRHDSLKR